MKLSSNGGGLSLDGDPLAPEGVGDLQGPGEQ